MISLPKFQIFGSENSTDIDVLFFVEEIPSQISKCADLCKEFNNMYATFYKEKRTINSNLAVLNNGILVDVFKGTTDELNNALFCTYLLHNQEFGNSILRLLDRDVNLKYLRCARMILSFLSRTTYRNSVKLALKGSIETKLDVLKSINLNSLVDFGKNMKDLEIKKSIAFQLGQTLLLSNGIEVYTKNDISRHINQLEPYLKRREPTDFLVLQTYLTAFSNSLEARIPNMIYKTEYKFDASFL
ncbi:MAG: hypothetical protein MUE53_09995 [Chitinophagales bacterium]|jgi:hypothetical protein|nr:hypothetical protein [Chitinophagales bacterium]